MSYPLNKLGLKNVCDYTFAPGASCAQSLNPKGFDSPRALPFSQDKPSQTAGINETNVYNEPNLTQYHAGAPYGSHRCTHADFAHWATFPAPNRGRTLNSIYAVNNGQIQYYIDPSIKAPYYSPAFDMPSRSELVDYVDPMGSWKPHYTYDAIYPARYSCLSFINDTSFHREDLMARQQAVYNQTRSDPLFN